jgi:hypothetical protein
MSHSTTTIVEMDAASKALAEAPPDDDRTWAVRADASGIPLTTLLSASFVRGERGLLSRF